MSDERATLGQVDLIGRLMRSHVVTDEERAALLNAIAAGTLTKKRAGDQIDGLLRAIKDRKRQEQAAGGDA